ncbi:HEPN domain-containing protein [Streptomyces aculeolatus]
MRPPESRPVESLYQSQRQMLDELQQREPSFHATLQTMLPKILMLAAASEFEHHVCTHLRMFVKETTSSLRIPYLVDQKAINRQYHTLFDWKVRKAGKFWALFGPDFKKAVESEISTKEELQDGLSAFLTIGATRNELIHNNYADMTLNTTLDEVHDLYLSGTRFVESIPDLLRIEIVDERPLSDI